METSNKKSDVESRRAPPQSFSNNLNVRIMLHTGIALRLLAFMLMCQTNRSKMGLSSPSKLISSFVFSRLERLLRHIKRRSRSRKR